MNAHPLTRSGRTTLILAGIILLLVGVPIVLGPLAYQASMGVVLPDDPTLLSDLRAMGGSLLGFGLLLVGSARGPHARHAALAGAVLFLSYGTSRLLSMALDGLPTGTLVGSAAIELLIGAALVAAVLRADHAPHVRDRALPSRRP